MTSEYQEIIDKSYEGLAVLTETPFGRAICFPDEPVELHQRTPLTHETLVEIADEFEQNRHLWPADMDRP